MPVSSANKVLNENKMLEALFQNASVGMLVVDRPGNIIMANNFLIAMFGYENSQELIGSKIEMLLPSRFHNHHVRDRDKYNAHPERRPMGEGRDLFGVKKNGAEFPVEISLSSYENEQGFFVVAFVSDITKRKEIEQSVVAQQEELASINKTIEKLNTDLEDKVIVRTQQLQSAMQQLEKSKDELSRALNKEKELGDLKSRFVSMASHEFRTPLSTILSSASLLSKYNLSEEQDKREKHVNRIKSAVNNLTDILNDLLSIDKIEEGKVKAKESMFNVSHLVEGLCNELNGILKPGQTLVYKHQGSAEVYLDASLLKNTLVNLISNAIKFSGNDSVININTLVTSSEFVLKVKDKGLGIPKEDQKHLFERFFRGTNVTNIEGTGLGLHIVAKYVELMKGHISMKSDTGKGTEFIITFKI